MHKRIEFYVRNPGYEGTQDAMGVRAIDFQDVEAFKMAQQTINSRMQVAKQAQHPFQLQNEREEMLGIVPEYVVSWRIYNVDDEWQAVFSLPPGGDPAPPRES